MKKKQQRKASKKSHEGYEDLLEEVINKIRQHGRKRHENLQKEKFKSQKSIEKNIKYGQINFWLAFL